MKLRYPLSIAYITAREKPHFNWFLQSLKRQLDGNILQEIILVDALQGVRPLMIEAWVRHVAVKPNYWSGEHRLPKDNWWSKGAAINTALCLAKGHWICFADDRSVLMPGFFDAINGGMTGDYIVAGAYEKRTGLEVVAGQITNQGSVTGKDSRLDYLRAYNHTTPYKCGGEWLFGCLNAAPMNIWLNINGSPEDICDGLGMEDIAAGLVMNNNGYPIKYDPRLKMIQDRTPGECKPVMHKTDMGVSPNDKSHKVLEILKTRKDTGNGFSLKKMRKIVQATGKFPMPERSKNDWWDGRPLKDFRPV